MTNILIFAALIFAGCGNEAELSQIKIDNRGEIPEGMGKWNSSVHWFEGNEAEKVEYCLFADVEKIKGKGTVSVAAISNTANVSWYPKASGSSPIMYCLHINSPETSIPEIWVSSPSEGRKGRIKMLPFTSSINIRYIDAPEDFSGATVKAEKCTDAIYLYRSEPGSRENPVDIKRTIGAGGGGFKILPMSDGGKLSVDIAIGEMTYPATLDIPAIGKGEDVEIVVDFSRLSQEQAYQIEYTSSDHLSGKEIYKGGKTVNLHEFDADYSDLNRHYEVEAHLDGRWKSIRTYDALCSDAAKHRQIWNDWGNDKQLRDTMSYTIIESPFDSPLRIKVKKKGGRHSEVEVRPSSYGISPEENADGSIEFTIPSEAKGKVSVEFDGDRQHNFFVICHKKDENKPTGGKVRYYGEGEHEVGNITLFENETLYIDYGAKVYGTVRIQGNNCTLAGNGILSGEKLRHWGENGYSNGALLIDGAQHKSGLTIKDLTIIDSPSWNLRLQNHSNVLIDGITMISWILNGDGIDILSSHDVEIRNCLLRTYDDAITLKVRFTASPVNDLYNVHVHDNVIYSDYARGIVVGPEAGNTVAQTGYIHDITIEDCHFLNHGGGGDQSDIRAAFAIGQYARYGYSSGSATAIENITARNLTFDNIGKGGQNISIIQDSAMDKPCTMNNVLLENFIINDRLNPSTPAFYVNRNQNHINGMVIRNCIIDGQKLSGAGSDFTLKGSGTADIKFE